MTSIASAFLHHILPTEGYKVAVEFSGKRVSQKFFTSIDALAAHILQQNTLGKTVYHACASFKTSDNRKQDNAFRAKSFWLDIDCGAGKPYADPAAGAEAVASFCRACALPIPTYVASGYGLHVYWPLAQVLDPAAWKGAAERLRSLCTTHNLDVDRVRTCDLSSVLRTPGTHNRKHGGHTVVQAGTLTGPYRLEELGDVGRASGISKGNTRSVGMQRLRSRGRARTGLSSLTESAGSIYADEPSYAEAISNSCQQLAALKNTGGRLSEPDWYSCLGVLAACVDGYDFSHSWSAGYEGYTFAETQSRLDRARQFGPTTCAKFESLNPIGCTGCPHRGRITSPIQLGRTIQPIVRQPETAHGDDSKSKEKEPSVEKTAAGSIENVTSPQNSHKHKNVPEGFEVTPTQVVFKTETGPKGKPVCEVVCGSPIYLNSVQVGEIADDKHSYDFHCLKPHEGWRSVGIGAKKLFGQTGISEMFERGVTIHHPDLFRRYVRESIDMFHTNEQTLKRYEQFGWKDNDNAFLWGKTLYSAGGREEIIGSDEVRTRSQWLGPAKGGSLVRWKAAANNLFAKGCEAQSFALLCAFAAPLMKLHEEDEGGAIVSLVNKQSGTGKTTALDAVASVWGRSEGLKLTNEDTRVSKSIVLGVLGNLPVIWDELHNKDPDIIREFVLTFTGGRDKLRATQEGELRHTKAKWATLLITAQNRSIVEQLSNVQGTDAPAFRVIEFKVDPPEGNLHHAGDRLKRELKSNYGYAGDVFLQYLVRPEVRAWVRQALPQWTEDLWKQTKFNSEHRFWVRTLGSVAVAAAIVDKLQLLDFSPKRIIEWAIEDMQDRSRNPTVTGHNTADIDILSEFLNEHVQNTLVMPGPFVPGRSGQLPRRLPLRELRVRFELDPARIVIPVTYFRKWLTDRSLSARDILSQLVKRQIVKNEKHSRTLGAGTDLPGGQIPCIEVNANHPALSGVLAEVVTFEKGFGPSSPRTTLIRQL